MSPFKTLIRREWLEGRTAYLAAPAVVLSLVLLAGLATSLVEPDVSISTNSDQLAGMSENASGMALLLAMLVDVAGSTDAEMTYKMETLAAAVARPFELALTVVIFFALIGSVHDERKDRSVLFWKSMPVSDTRTMISKYVTIAWVAPVATIIATWLAQLFAMTWLAINVEDGFAGRVWAFSTPTANLIYLVIGYGIQGLWAMPVYAWLILVSAVASRIPTLWAVGIPVVLIILEKIVAGTSTSATFLFDHIQPAALPRLDNEAPLTISSQLAVLADPSLWVGMIIGSALLAAAIYSRKRLNEI